VRDGSHAGWERSRSSRSSRTSGTCGGAPSGCRSSGIPRTRRPARPARGPSPGRDVSTRPRSSLGVSRSDPSSAGIFPGCVSLTCVGGEACGCDSAGGVHRADGSVVVSLRRGFPFGERPRIGRLQALSRLEPLRPPVSSRGPRRSGNAAREIRAVPDGRSPREGEDRGDRRPVRCSAAAAT
jgi:hypothetical protein